MASLDHESALKAKWQEIKADLLHAWDKLTGEELEESGRDLDQIAGLVQRKYGVGQADVRMKLEEVLARHRAELKEKHQVGEDLIEREDRDGFPASLRDQYRQL